MRGRWGLALLATIAGCAAPPAAVPPPFALTAAGFGDLPGWTDDPAAEVLPALAVQCRRLAALPPDAALGGQAMAQLYGGRPAAWRAACAALPPAPDDGAVRRYLEAWFQPYRIQPGAVLGGYFEPVVRGALAPDATYRVPVLARPADLVATRDEAGHTVVGRQDGGQLVPYWTRADIDAGRSAARPLLYLASPIDLVILQIEGAGRVVLPDGSAVRLAFAGSNGRASTPVGRTLVQRRALAPADVTLANVRAWLAANPTQAASVIDADAHYTFFRLAPDLPGMGPAGAFGVPLTPGRSAAVDRAYVPLGSPLFFDTHDPVSGGAWRHLVLAQDTGADVRGPARADIFLGSTPEAARMAGEMHEPGTAWLLLPRPADAKLAQSFEQNLNLRR